MLNLQSYATELAKQKQLYGKYSAVLGIYKSASELNAKKQEIEKQIIEAESQHRVDLQKYHDVLGSARELAEIQAEHKRLQDDLADARAALGLARDELAMEEVGLYRRIYDFDDPVEYKDKLDDVRNRQREMAKLKEACTCTTTWVVEGSEAKGRKMAQEQIKLMLRAFNGECDAAVAKVKIGNIESLEKRIRKAFDDLNKLGDTKRIEFNPMYLNLKIRELQLTHELAVCKQNEKERQRELREQLAEEAKAEREIEQAKQAAEQEESLKARALEDARAQLASEHGAHNAKLEALVAKLENELKDAIDRKAKAIARAQLTRSGHVYVLSNIGTMGKNRFKIGMTRRLEPLVRVAELGDASVPFPFDVHAMIYCEDAPALEASLHAHFHERRVNLVNLRKEYFDVSLPEIIEAVTKYHGRVTFALEPDAEQYKETMAIRSETANTLAIA